MGCSTNIFDTSMFRVIRKEGQNFLFYTKYQAYKVLLALANII